MTNRRKNISVDSSKINDIKNLLINYIENMSSNIDKNSLINILYGKTPEEESTEIIVDGPPNYNPNPGSNINNEKWLVKFITTYNRTYYILQNDIRTEELNSSHIELLFSTYNYNKDNIYRIEISKDVRKIESGTFIFNNVTEILFEANNDIILENQMFVSQNNLTSLKLPHYNFTTQELNQIFCFTITPKTKIFFN